MIAKIDLRTDLAKVRANINIDAMGRCKYVSPCAIGAMIDDPFIRQRLDEAQDQGSTNLEIHTLVKIGAVEMPAEQVDDAKHLQSIFDNSGDRQLFWEKFAELERKYAS
jgi:hypothetical protein